MLFFFLTNYKLSTTGLRFTQIEYKWPYSKWLLFWLKINLERPNKNHNFSWHNDNFSYRKKASRLPIGRKANTKSEYFQRFRILHRIGRSPQYQAEGRENSMSVWHSKVQEDDHIWFLKKKLFIYLSYLALQSV